MTISLFRDMLRWNWSIEDDDGETLRWGYASDYTTATTAALTAFNALTDEGR